MSIDIYEASHQIVEAFRGLTDTEIRKSILMALVAVDKTDLLVDPLTLVTATRQVSPEAQKLPN